MIFHDDDEAAMREHISKAIRASLDKYIGQEPEVGTTAVERVQDALTGVLGPDRQTQVTQDGTVMHIRFNATPEEVGQIAYSMYAEGSTHEAVTAWFEEHAPTFREHMAEVCLPDGTYQWITRPRWIVGTYTVSA